MQELVGSVGGYIGLCLGYSILQLPDIVLSAIRYFKKYYSEKFNKGHDISTSSFNSTTKENGEIKRLSTHKNDLKNEINLMDIENS